MSLKRRKTRVFLRMQIGKFNDCFSRAQKWGKPVPGCCLYARFQVAGVNLMGPAPRPWPGNDGLLIANLGSLWKKKRERWRGTHARQTNKLKNGVTFKYPLFKRQSMSVSTHATNYVQFRKQVISTLTLQNVSWEIISRICGNEYSLSVTRLTLWLVSDSPLISFLYFFPGPFPPILDSVAGKGRNNFKFLRTQK